jgi:DNA repair protein RecN (Recombination protein N)
VTGGRAPSRLASGDEASVEAVVEVPADARSRLADAGVEVSEEAILARRVGADGRTKAWLDGRLVPVSVLSEIGETLIELHGQGAGFALAHASTQLRALDALAGNDDLLASYVEALRSLRAIHAERAQLSQDAAAVEREGELLAYQADEIERADLRPDEDEDVAEELSRLEHAERLSEAGARVLDLAGAEGAAGKLAEAHHAVEALASLDSRLPALVERLAEASALATDIAWDVRTWLETLEGDSSRIGALRERKALIASLKRKYGEDVVGAGRRARARLDELETSTTRLSALDAEADRVRAAAQDIAARLSRKRRDAARRLTKMVGAELPALALPNAVFEAECSASEEWTESGRDKVAFRFTESSVRAPDLIGKVASGGELSRAMIAVTLALASSHRVPVLLFDEADQGVGGEAALDLARRLAKLARTHQVLVVSHLPQIAAFADRHIAVRRRDDDISVEALDGADRLAEVSRMLAGLGSSDLAKAHAAELLELAARERDEALRRAG